MQLKLGLLIINLPKAPLHQFLENYVPPEVIKKLILNEPAIIGTETQL